NVFSKDKVGFEVVFNLSSMENRDSQIAYVIDEDGNHIAFVGQGLSLIGNIGVFKSNYAGRFSSNVYVFPGDGGTELNSSVQRQAASPITIYPNPVTNNLKIKSASTHKLKLYDCSGILLQVVNNANNIDMSNLQKGVYVLKIDNSSFKILKD
ncbi:MAG: T9SS type A sorting domain-containing protein, partial [Bacteroidales bacterium]|nr:T9SS type A sorting domain-containing protein [Bacteroidales bacterium]